MFDRLRVRIHRWVVTRVSLDKLRQEGAYLALVRGKVLHLEGHQHTCPEREVHPSGFYLLELSEQRAVKRCLKHCTTLCRSGELGIDHFVVGRLWSRLTVGRGEKVSTDEEVRYPNERRSPSSPFSHEQRLVYDVRAAPQRSDGFGRRIACLWIDLHYSHAFGAEAFEHIGLVFLTSAH